MAIRFKLSILFLFIVGALFCQDEEAAAAEAGALSSNDYTLAYKTYLAQADSNSFLQPNPAVKAIQNQFFVELEGVGLLEDTNRFIYLTAQQSQGMHRLNLVQPQKNILVPKGSGSLNFVPGRGISTIGEFYYTNGLEYRSSNIDALNDYTIGAYINALCDTCLDGTSVFAGFGGTQSTVRTSSILQYQDFGDRLTGAIRSAQNNIVTATFNGVGNSSAFPQYLEVSRFSAENQIEYADSLGVDTINLNVSGNTLSNTIPMGIMAAVNIQLNGDTTIVNPARDQVSLLILGKSITDAQRAQLVKSTKKYLSELQQLVKADTINPYWNFYEVEDDGISALPFIPGRVASHGMQTTAGSGRNLNRPDLHGIIKTISTKDEWENLIEPYIPNQNQFGFLDSLRRIDTENDTIPVTILFDRSGTWQPDSNIHKSYSINKNYLTFAFFTAPPPGIRLHDYQLVIRGDHIAIMHMRHGGGIDTVPGEERTSTNFPGGWTMYGERDCIKGNGNFHVYDHNTFSFATDELVQFSGNNITASHNMFCYPYNYIFHHKGRHAKGAILFNQAGDTTQGQNIAMYRNFYHTTEDRTPQLGGGIKGVFYENFINNNKFGTQVLASNSYPLKQHHKNIYYANFDRFVFRFLNSSDTTVQNELFLENFIIEGQDSTITDPYQFSKNFGSIVAIPEISSFGGNPPLFPEQAMTYTAPDSLPNYNFMPLYRLKPYCQYNSGAFPLHRDPVEKLAEQDVLLGIQREPLEDDTDYLPTPIYEVNEATWTLPADPYEIQPSGYTTLEVWLHNMAAAVEKPNP
jgi:hypothetical protein